LWLFELCILRDLSFCTEFQEWTDVIFRCATNLLVLNGSVIQFLEKCYAKLTLVRDNEGKIPVRK